jgi:hypothetical protein
MTAFRDVVTGDSVPLMIKNAVTGTPFTFVTFNKNTL